MNKLLSKHPKYLLVVMSVFIIAATLLTINEFGFPSFTGMVTEGDITVTVAATTTVNITDTSIAFGSGQLDDGIENCQLNSSKSTASDCSTFTNPGDGLDFENVGSEDIHVTVNSTKNAATFIGGDHAEFKFYCSCDVGAAGSGHINATAQTCCANLTAPAANDNGMLNVTLNISTGATTGSQQTATLYFYAESP